MQYYTVQSLARMMGKSRNTIREFVEQGIIEAVDTAKPGSKYHRWIISADAVKAFEESRSSKRICPPVPLQLNRGIQALPKGCYWVT